MKAARPTLALAALIAVAAVATGARATLGSGDAAAHTEHERIVYVSSHRLSSLWSIHSHGTGRTRLVAAERDVYVETPVLSPDRATVVYVRREGGRSDLWAVGMDGTEPHRLTTSRGDDEYPVWSPDGMRLIWVQGGFKASRVRMMNADGSGKHTVVPGTGGAVSAPSWSLDGTRIAYQHRRTCVFCVGDSEIHVAASDGSDVRRLTRNRAEDWSPVWLPGDRIAYVGSGGRHEGIVVMHADGSGKSLLVGFPRTTALFSLRHPPTGAGSLIRLSSAISAISTFGW